MDIDLELDDQPIDLLADEQEEQPAAAAKEEAEPEVEVEVAEDERYKKRWKKDPAEKLNSENDKDYSRGVQKRIAEVTAAAREFERRYQIEAAEKAEALKIAQAQMARIAALEEKLATGNVKTLENAEIAENNAVAAATEEYKAALVSGDAARVAAATAKMSAAAANAAAIKARLAEKKEESEQKKAAVQQQPVQQQQAPKQPPQMPKETIDWFRRNPWFNPNGGDELSDTAIDAHRKLLAKGAVEGSPEYFAAIDKYVRAKHPESFGMSRSNTPPPAQRQAPSTQQDSPFRGNKLVFTKSQEATAASLGLDIRNNKRHALEFAKHIASVSQESNQ